jgi:signal transduction histidine kinase
MIIGVVGLCVGLLAGGLALVAALGLVLQRSVDGELDRTASDVAALVNADALPQPVPVTGTSLVQVVDSSYRVRAASIDGDQLVPMLRPAELAQARRGERLFIDGDRLGLTGPVRVVAVPAGPPSDPQTVIVARPMYDVVRGVDVIRTTLLVVFPLLVVVLAAVAWRVIGASLRPVETLRRSAEEITGTGQSTRLPVPRGHDEIHRLAITLNGMLDRLDRGRARQREFVADAAHELRSPLANIRTQLEVARRLGHDTDWPALADDLLADTTRLSTLVDDLLLLARTDSSPTLRRPEPVELRSLVSRVAARYPSVADRAVEVGEAGSAVGVGEAGATVGVGEAGSAVGVGETGPTVEVRGAGPSDRVAETEPAGNSGPECPVWTSGEPDALARVVANLLDNAVRHARSRVVVEVEVEDPGALITITDDGPGIPAADRERVFERFARLDDGRARDAGGAGLGLAIVRELVRRHRGTVRLGDAQPGLRVEVRLPLEDPSVTHPSTTDPCSTASSSTDPSSTGLSSTDPSATGLSSTDPSLAAAVSSPTMGARSADSGGD